MKVAERSSRTAENQLGRTVSTPDTQARRFGNGILVCRVGTVEKAAFPPCAAQSRGPCPGEGRAKQEARTCMARLVSGFFPVLRRIPQELDGLCNGKESAGANRIDGLVAVVGIHLFHDAPKMVFYRELRQVQVGCDFLIR